MTAGILPHNLEGEELGTAFFITLQKALALLALAPPPRLFVTLEKLVPLSITGNTCSKSFVCNGVPLLGGTG